MRGSTGLAPEACHVAWSRRSMATLWDLIVAEFVESKEALSTNGSPRLAGDSMQDLDSSPLTPYTDRSTEAPASLPGSPPTPIDPKTCNPREYLEHFIFPVLLPGLAELLSQARLHRCFERKKTKFFPCDFLAEWLYNKNPARCQEQPTEVLEIPFVKEWLRDHPRPPLPLSLLLTEEQAAIIIQAFYRGYLVRREPEVQELRQWQRELREESRDIRLRVADFWASREPSEGAQTPSELDAGVSINVISPSPLNTPLL
ncbi:IQ domain-containing protein K isoform X3 [Lethenteron reissneri]|uniref:IQ domain-containing protein K isoform X3 n=1 Tax=Lethenteron reissneri TaxID=7753 RepID=UPI002AB5F8D6|nr:IQ domain-containing protein K isoform X3 [Lethenteron reissneri]